MCLLVCWSFFSFLFFLTPFFFQTDLATDQQTNKPTLGPISLRSIALHGVSMLVASANKPPSDQHSAATIPLHPFQSPTRCHPQPPGPTVAWLECQHPSLPSQDLSMAHKGLQSRLAPWPRHAPASTLSPWP